MESLLVFLFVFCAIMSAIAIGRVMLADDPDPVVVGAALLVVAITIGTLVWLGLESSALTLRLALALVGASLLSGVSGVALMGLYWE